MGTVGTFETFTTARLGIYAAQKGLSVTGNNISNINTIGYTRQRVDQVSLKTGANDRYRSEYDNHVGNGVLVTGISQIRDPYLDIRYRTERSDVGYTDTKLNGLNYISAILEEVAKGENDGDGLLYAQLQKMAESLRSLSASAGDKTNDTLLQGAAESLAMLFNQYAGKLESLRQTTMDSFQESLDAVNGILTNIRNLNDAIRKSDIHGDGALEMRDERNRQIDALSEYMKIDVVYSMEDIGGGTQVEKLTIRLGNANPDKQVTSDSAVLVDGIFAAHLEMPDKIPEINPQYDPASTDAVNQFRYLVTDPDTGAVRGTDDPEEANQVSNVNFNLTVGKLLDDKGREWKDSTVTWTPVTPDVPGTRAIYTVPITTNGWANGDVIDIGDGLRFQVAASGGHLTEEEANDPVKLAEVIAARLNRYDRGYAVTAEDGSLVFTARKAGAVGPTDKATLKNQGPDAEPALPKSVSTGGASQTAAIIFGSLLENAPGTDAVLPALPPDQPIVSADGRFSTYSTYAEKDGEWFRVETTVQHTLPVNLDDNDLYGSLQATRELLTESGEFSSSGTINGVDESAAIKRGIPFYQKALDLLANQFATRYNELNSGYLVDQNGHYIRDTGRVNSKGETVYETIADPGTQVTYYVNEAGEYQGLTDPTGTLRAITSTLSNNMNANEKKAFQESLAARGYDSIDAYLTAVGGIKVGGNLFSNQGDSNDATGITASNISVALDWSEGKTHVVTSYVKLFNGDVPNTTQNENVDHMISMLDKALVYNPQDIEPNAASEYLFNGSFNDMLSKVWSTLGNDQRITSVVLDNHYTYMTEVDTNRDSVSGVDLNDEAMNMMQYQKAYSAACRLMTTIDEALDRLINNTGVVGR